MEDFDFKCTECGSDVIICRSTSKSRPDFQADGGVRFLLYVIEKCADCKRMWSSLYESGVRDKRKLSRREELFKYSDESYSSQEAYEMFEEYMD